MNAIAAFRFEGGQEIRTSSHPDTGAPLFAATDVAKALGYVDPVQAVRMHCEEIWGVVLTTQTGSHKRDLKFLAEPAVWALIMRSKLPSAKTFQRWVFEVVLPQIRKTGSFSVRPEGDIEARYFANCRGIPRGYRSVINEFYLLINKDLDQFHDGLRIPTRGDNGKHIRPETSVGQFWARRYTDIADDPDDFKLYTHKEVGWGWQGEAKCYPVRFSGHFAEYLLNEWFHQEAPRYFKQRAFGFSQRLLLAQRVGLGRARLARS